MLLDMDHADHLSLIRKGVPGPGGVWGEFGSGRGAFTLALAELIGSTGVIYSIDKDSSALKDQQRAVRRHFMGQEPSINYWTADYTKPLDLPSLDGLLMANSLHFQRDKKLILKLILEYLSPGGHLILVEYNIHQGNPWVPYPIPYLEWEQLAQECGLVKTRMLAVRPSRSMKEIYSAASIKPT
jgi:ubiquinone/menaquinone biosynthesis C-methylase UbiE